MSNPYTRPKAPRTMNGWVFDLMPYDVPSDTKKAWVIHIFVLTLSVIGYMYSRMI